MKKVKIILVTLEHTAQLLYGVFVNTVENLGSVRHCGLLAIVGKFVICETVLEQLHWLPMNECINCNMLMFTCNDYFIPNYMTSTEVIIPFTWTDICQSVTYRVGQRKVDHF